MEIKRYKDKWFFRFTLIPAKRGEREGKEGGERVEKQKRNEKGRGLNLRRKGSRTAS